MQHLRRAVVATALTALCAASAGCTENAPKAPHRAAPQPEARSVDPKLLAKLREVRMGDEAKLVASATGDAGQPVGNQHGGAATVGGRYVLLAACAGTGSLATELSDGKHAVRI